MRLILLAILALQAAPAQSEADKVEAALKKFGDRTYQLKGGLTPVTVVMKTRIERDGDRRVAVFIDGDHGGTAVEKASFEGLLLLSEVTSDPKGKVWKEITVRDGQALIKSGHEQKKIAVTKSLVGVASLWRLICMKEQKVGAEFKVDLLLTGDTVNKDHQFRCVAKETVEIGEVKREAFKWDEKGEWEFEGKKSPVSASYWVSPDGYLLRWTAFKDGAVSHEMTLDTK